MVNLNIKKIETKYCILFGEYIIEEGKVKESPMYILSGREKRMISDNILTNQSYFGDGKYIGYLNSYDSLKKSNKNLSGYLIGLYDSHTGKITELLESKTKTKQIIRSIKNNSIVVYGEDNCGIIEYDLNSKEKKMIIKFDIYKGHQVYVSENGKNAYYHRKGRINKLSLESNESIDICDSCAEFAISKDESFAIVIRKKDDSYIVDSINLVNGNRTELFKSKEYISNIRISEDNSQILYRITKELGVADVSQTLIYLYDINKNTRKLLYKSKFFNSTQSICWGECC